jgi:ribose transport system substrate-binding protein
MRSRVTSGIVAGVVLGIGSLIISACGSSGASSTASPGTSSGTQSASAASAAIPTLVNLPCSKDQGLKGDVVGLNFEESESVFSQLQSDIEEFAKLSNCGLTFKVTNAQGDPATQVQQAEELITDKVNLLFTNPAEAPGWQVVGPLAKANNTIWMNWSSVVEPDATVNATVDQALSGSLVAAPVAQWINKYQGGKAQVAMLVSLTDPGFKARATAFEARLKQLVPGVQFVGIGNGGFSSPQVAEQSTQNLIEAHPNLKVIFADWDGAALGAEQAARSLGKTNPQQFYIAGQDGSTEQLQDMQKPGNVLQATGADLFRYDAGIVVRDMEKLLMHETVLPTRYLIPELITSATVNKFIALQNDPFSNANSYVFNEITRYYPYHDTPTTVQPAF